MTVHTFRRLANRLGYGLGLGVRFFLQDENVVLRWTKRLVLFAAILLVLSFSTVIFHWLARVIEAMAIVVSVGLLPFSGVLKGSASTSKKEEAHFNFDNDPYSPD